MLALLQTIALLCVATPGTNSVASDISSVRNSQAKCQMRLLSCYYEVIKPTYGAADDGIYLSKCVEKGKVKD